MKDNKKEPTRREHGAITIFLVLILVPVMIFTCTFGDVARVSLSRSQATAAADLALYSLMSNYDEKLKEWYGLVASVQNIDEFYDVTESYFTGMLSVNGVDGTASEKFSSFIAAMRNSKDLTDFLQIESQKDTFVGAVANGAMGGNAALIEDGIVEFMKYRGPVAIVQRIINRFSEGSGAGELTEAQKNEPIVEKKQEYAEAEGKMIEELLHTYMALLNYTYYYAGMSGYGAAPDANLAKILKFDNLKDSAERLKYARDDMEQVNLLITKYYSFTKDISDVSSHFINYDKLPEFVGEKKDEVKYTESGSEKRVKLKDIGIESAELPEGEKPFLTPSQVSDILKNADKILSDVETAAGNVAKALGSIPSPSGASDDNVNPAVYLMKIQNTVSTSDLDSVKNNGKKLMNMYAQIMLAQECDLPDPAPNQPTWGSKLSDYKTKIESSYKNYLSYRNATTQFETILNQYNTTKNNWLSAIKNKSLTFKSTYCQKYSGTSEVTVGTFMAALNNDLGLLYDRAKQQISNIDVIINGGKISFLDKKYDVVSLASLKSIVRDAAQKRESWGKAAGDEDTSYAKDEYDEYNGKKITYVNGERKEVPSAKTVPLPSDTDKAIDELSTRLQNIRKDLQDYVNAVDGFSYGGKAVAKLATVDNAIAATKGVIPTDVNQVGATLTDNEQAAAGYLKSLLKPLSGELYTPPTIKSGKTGNNPDIRAEADRPEMFGYMLEAMPESTLKQSVDAKNAQEKENDEMKDQASKLEEASKSVDKNFTKELGSDLAYRTPGADDEYGVLKALGGLVDVIKALINGNIDEIRDQIYFVEYVMDMFSFSAYDNEGQYRLAKVDKKNVGLVKFMAQGYSYGDKYEKAWKTYDVTKFTENVSLTNRPVNKQNNQANLAEIEYILYGKSSNSKNLTAAYTSIYGIRFLLDTISGFQLFYTPKNATGTVIESIAASVMAATMGLIPEPLTKCILIMLLVVLEAVYDLNSLKAGSPVPLYKSKDSQWVMQIGSKEQLKQLLGGKNNDKETELTGLFYSDYIFLFLLLGSNNNGLYKDMLIRTGDLIQANMVKGGEEGFQLNKAQVYFTLKSAVTVKPLFLGMPIVDSFDTGGTNASDVREATDWRTYEINMIRGYS